MKSGRTLIHDGNPRGCADFVSKLLLLVLICITPFRGSAQSGTSHQLTLKHPEDGDFGQLLNDNFPGFENLDDYRAIRPFLVVLRNDTSHWAKAYAVEWNIQSSDRMLHKLVTHFIQKHNATAAEQNAFGPGELRLISPLFNLSPSDYARQHESVAKLLSTFSPLPPYSSTNIVSITAAVDGVIYEDGAYVGADHFQLLTIYQCVRDAERDEATSVLKLMDSNAPIGDVVALLERDVQVGLAKNTGNRDRDSICAFQHAAEAQRLLGLYRRGGIQTLTTRAWAATQHPHEKISRVSQE